MAFVNHKDEIIGKEVEQRGCPLDSGQKREGAAEESSEGAEHPLSRLRNRIRLERGPGQAQKAVLRFGKGKVGCLPQATEQEERRGKGSGGPRG